MRLTVLGKSPAWEDAGGACSSYLVEAGSLRLLIDCGNGAFAQLREHVDYTAIDAVLISHLHADHVLDLIPYAYALTLGPAAAAGAKLPLLCPPGSVDFFRRIVGAWGDEDLIGAAFEIEEYAVASSHRLGELAIDLHPVPHFTLTHAIALTAPGGDRIVYGADCRSGPELIAASRGAELLLAEATLPEPESDSVPLAERGHMSALEAGAVARAAGVGRLVLVHLSDELDQAKALADAEAEFEGPVEIACPGSSWQV